MKITFNKLITGQRFFRDFPSGKWILYKKISGTRAEIEGSIDQKGIGYEDEISAYQLVTPTNS